MPRRDLGAWRSLAYWYRESDSEPDPDGLLHHPISYLRLPGRTYPGVCFTALPPNPDHTSKEPAPEVSITWAAGLDIPKDLRQHTEDI